MSKAKCCEPSCGCCGPRPLRPEKRTLVIDFLYLDMDVCTRCQGTGRVLGEAIADVSMVLEQAGIDVVLNKVKIDTRELATEHRLLSSPTIRIDGHDIDADIQETTCESCGDLCGDTVDCRVWIYGGVEYTQPPKAMIVNALLQAVYGVCRQPEEQEYTLPDNLSAFFDAMERKEKG